MELAQSHLPQLINPLPIATSNLHVAIEYLSPQHLLFLLNFCIVMTKKIGISWNSLMEV
jgi:hypothetical protein